MTEPLGITATALDKMHATMYAMDVVKRLKCQDPEILKEYGNGLVYVENKKNRLYPCPTGANIKHECKSGNCAMTEGLCNAQSTDPYNSDGTPISPKPKQPYLEWRPDNTHPAGGRCVMGNFPLMQWCKYPAYRRSEPAHGVTDVPSFTYDPSSGNCSITKPYCDWMEVSYKIDDKGRPTCYTKEGQKFAEKWVVGRTIYRGLKGWTGGRFSESFQKNPPKKHIMKMMDSKKMKSYKNIGPNFGGQGVNLYTIVWSNDAVKYDPNALGATTGFLSSEIKKKYPKFIKKKDGLDWIEIDIEDAKKDRYQKRIYLSLSSGGWMLEGIKSLLQSVQQSK